MGLLCLSMSHKKDARRYGLNMVISDQQASDREATSCQNQRLSRPA